MKGDVRVESGEDFSTLTIKPASGKYSGKFKVVAENEVGKDEAEMEASVVGEWVSQYPIKNQSVGRSIQTFKGNLRDHSHLTTTFTTIKTGSLDNNDNASFCLYRQV